jgi:uncharacterized protein (TIGR03086 family)
MDDRAALQAATNEFARRLSAVAADRWGAATPCGDWDVTALVTHINVGNQMSVLLLDGADAATSVGPRAQPTEGSDPATAYAETSAAQVAAFDADSALTTVVHHPAMDMPGDALLMFRALDLAMHGWDLATATDGDTTLDDELCQWLWGKLSPIAPMLAGSGLFGTPQRELPEGATAQDTLLHATGR